MQKYIIAYIYSIKICFSKPKNMKKIKITLLVTILSIFAVSAKAQLKPFDFLYGYTSDASLMMQEYIRPYANIMGANLNAGWYNTAKPHKLGGFDVTATFSIAFAPDEALFYDLADLTGLQAEFDPNNSIAPTIAGDQESLPELVSYQTINGNEYEVARIKHPNGLGVKGLPLPMAQVSLGLIKGTDVTVRFVPNIEIGEYGDLAVFGIGGRHSISQWIPVLKRLEFINISLQGGYTKVSTNAFMNIQPADVEIQPATTGDFNDQNMQVNISGWTLNIIASQSIPVITVYEGIGFANSAMDFAVLGNYPVNSIVTEPGPDLGKTTYDVIEDPIPMLEFENNRNLRLNAGIRFKLGVLTLHYDFTKTLYATHSAGIGISFR